MTKISLKKSSGQLFLVLKGFFYREFCFLKTPIRFSGKSFKVSRHGDTSQFQTIFLYEKGTNTWKWRMDGEENGKMQPFARVRLTKNIPTRRKESF